MLNVLYSGGMLRNHGMKFGTQVVEQLNFCPDTFPSVFKTCLFSFFSRSATGYPNHLKSWRMVVLSTFFPPYILTYSPHNA